ncbi:MAG TPA: AtpZ/AtpI family protein [Chloroflexota bacterium]|nr:AtpZ/AtpI family protein [Chloroflexota bacterium]
MSPRSPNQPGRPQRSGLALAGAIGGYVLLCIVLGLGLGLLLDKVLRTGPIFLIVGVLAGFGASFYLTYRLAMGELGE